MLIVGGILIGIFKGLLALFVYTIITLLLLAPAYFLVIKPRTCPSCKSFKYSIFHSRMGDENKNYKTEYYCKRCQNVWEKK